MMPFFCIHISQSSVATRSKRGGIFKHAFVANLLQSRLVKKFKNRIIISEVMAKSLVSCFFDSRCSFVFIALLQFTRVELRTKSTVTRSSRRYRPIATSRTVSVTLPTQSQQTVSIRRNGYSYTPASYTKVRALVIYLSSFAMLVAT